MFCPTFSSQQHPLAQQMYFVFNTLFLYDFVQLGCTLSRNLDHVILSTTFDPPLDCRDQTGSSRPGYPSGPSPPGSSRRRRENEANLLRSVWRPEERPRVRRGTKVVILLRTGARSPVQPMQTPLAKLHSRVY